MPFKAFVFVYATNAQRDAGVHLFCSKLYQKNSVFLCVIYCMYLVFSVVTVQTSWCHFWESKKYTNICSYL